MKSRPVFAAAAVTLAAVLTAPTGGAVVRAQTAPPAPTNPSLAAVQSAVRRGALEDARRLVSGIDPDALPLEDRAEWRRLARAVAVRTGDRTLLGRARDPEEARATLRRNLLLNASDFLQAGDLKAARGFLKRVPEPQTLGGRERYRYLSLQAHLERLAGNDAAERAALEALLAHVGAWSAEEGWGRPAAGGGAPPARENRPATAPKDLTAWWAGVRYAELLGAEGADAAAAVAREAEQRLAAGPPAPAAVGLTLRLAYALAAAGNTAARDSQLRSLPWSAAPPVGIAAYP